MAMAAPPRPSLPPQGEPPTAALPPLPHPKTRQPPPTSQALRIPSAVPALSKALPSTPSQPTSPDEESKQSIKSPSSATFPATPAQKPRSGIRTPSNITVQTKLGLPTPSRPKTPNSGIPGRPSLGGSTPLVPTLKNLANAAADSSGTGTERNVKRSISIAAFPNPPKANSRIGRPSLGGNAVTSPSGLNNASQESNSTGATPHTVRHKKPTSSKSSDSLRKVYAFSNSPSLLNGSGDTVSISASPGQRGSDGLLSINSPSHSRTSSAQGSYSTSATTFDDVDEPRRGRDEALTMASPTEKKPEVKGGNVIVSVRVRPDGKGKDAKKDGEWTRSEGEWMVDGRKSLIAYRGREGGDYIYDNVFSPHDGNEKVYDSSAKRLVRQVMEGYHGTVFAYGMTGTGKTFSMNGTTASPGIIPQSITDIFSYIRETPRREFLLRVSYLEIYNEKIHDLLSVDPNEGVANQQTEEIKLREDSKRGVYATPLKEEIVQSPTQLLRVISRGDQARKTGRTQWNAHSSRSHAVVQIVVESRERALADKRAPMTPGGVRVSTLSLIDLAGSERAAEDKTRRTEGAHINKSLLTLGTIIAKLSGGKDKNGNPIDKEGAHLPYRDSKLTRLLQPALSGNSLISILCTIQIGSSGSSAAANSHTGETLNTLKFASRAKNNIVSHAKRAEEAKGSSTDAASGALLEQYRMEIQGLRSQLDKQMKQQAEKDEKLMEKEEKQRHGETLLDMQLARTALKERIEHLNRIIITSQSTGVNSGKFSSLSMHPKLAAYSNSEAGARSSLRSSTSYTTIQRTTSGASSGTQHTTTPLETVHSPNGKSRFEEDDDDLGDGEASLQAQIRSLRHDITNKNRYITTLERRVDQARRSSHNRFSNGYGPFAAQVAAHEQAIEEKDAALKAKDAELKALRSRLDEQEKTIAALRATALKNGTESVASPAATPTEVAGPFSASTHKAQDSTASGASSNSASLSPVELLSSPSISPIAKFNSSVSFSPDLTSRDRKRESVDEMSRMLDQMIQSRVEQGALVRSQTGSVRVGRGMERRKESLGGIPSVGALARVLRPESQWLDGEEGNNGASTTIQEGKVF